MAISEVFTKLVSEYSMGKRQGVDHKHDEHMQVDEFYRKVGIGKLEEAVSFWAHYLVSFGDISKDIEDGSMGEKLQANKELIFVYGSARTIHDYAAYQQFNYRRANETKKSSQEPYQLLFFFAQIVVDLKYDFTGILTNPVDLLLAQITDMGDVANKDDFVAAYRSVMKLLGIPKKERLTSRLLH
ncbi:MAG: hypothetical protein LKI98_04575 [Bifidobacterium crudilactis]|jgi:hypothetical protein|nr:hypothetical protein [Bifidobacterium crudilactis]